MERLMWHLVAEEWQLCTPDKRFLKTWRYQHLVCLRRLTTIRSYTARLAADVAAKRQ